MACQIEVFTVNTFIFDNSVNSVVRYRHKNSTVTDVLHSPVYMTCQVEEAELSLL